MNRIRLLFPPAVKSIYEAKDDFCFNAVSIVNTRFYPDIPNKPYSLFAHKKEGKYTWIAPLETKPMSLREARGELLKYAKVIYSTSAQRYLLKDWRG